MPVQIAKDILDKEMSADSQFVEYQIDLAGGEPFTCFENVKEIVEYGVRNSSRWQKKFWFFICSNLTLLDDKIKLWLENNHDWVILGTSLDGTKSSHDRYRCGSYDAVMRHVPFYRHLYPEQGVKMTIGPDTVESIYEGILNIESMGLTVSANVVYEPVWGDGKHKSGCLRQFAEQLEMLVQHYVNNPDLPVPNLLTLPIQLFIKQQDPEHSWCGSGKTMRAYDSDGRVLPCHRFSRFCTNKIFSGVGSIGERVETKCDKCAYMSACPTCAGYNWQVYGNPQSRTSYHCEFIKLQFLAAAKLVFLSNQSIIKLLTKPGQVRDTEADAKILYKLKAADFVMRNINIDDIISQVNL